MINIKDEQVKEKINRIIKIYNKSRSTVVKIFKKHNISEEDLNKLSTSLFIQINKQAKREINEVDYERMGKILEYIYMEVNKEEFNEEGNYSEIIGGVISVFIQFNQEYRI